MGLIILAATAAQDEPQEDNEEKVTSNALSDLIVAFFSLCPEASDEQVHHLALALGYEPAGFEEVVYKLVGTQVARDPDAVQEDLQHVATPEEDSKPNPAVAEPEDNDEPTKVEKPGKQIEESSWAPHVAVAALTVVTEDEFLEPMDDFTPAAAAPVLSGNAALDDKMIDDGDPRPTSDDNSDIVNDGESSGESDNDAEKIALINDSTITQA